eukprot:15459799-Alexandrium_andersonii.AAC.1
MGGFGSVLNGRLWQRPPTGPRPLDFDPLAHGGRGRVLEMVPSARGRAAIEISTADSYTCRTLRP